MKQYDVYKKVNIDWIKQIPQEWKVVKLKHIYDFGMGETITKEELDNEGYPVYSATENDVIFGFKKNPRTILEYGDIVVPARGNSIGNVTLITNPSTCTQTTIFGKAKLNPEISKLIYYILKYNISSIFHFDNTAIPQITVDYIKNIKIAIPEPIGVMVKLLEEIEESIETFINKKQDYISSLVKYKKSRTYELLTKGFYSKRSLHNSGIQWVGDMPTDWKTKKLQYIFKVVKNIVNDLGHDVLSITQEGIKIKDLSKNEGQLSSDYTKYQIVNKGDFAMNHMDLLTGFVDISKYDGVTSPDYRVFKIVDSECYPKYMLYLLQLCYVEKIFYPLGRGASQLGRWRLGIDAFRSFLLPIPPVDEQREIVNLIEKESNAIQRLIDKAEKQVELIQDYRKSLIYELVTGKRKP